MRAALCAMPSRSPPPTRPYFHLPANSRPDEDMRFHLVHRRARHSQRQAVPPNPNETHPAGWPCPCARSGYHPIPATAIPCPSASGRAVCRPSDRQPQAGEIDRATNWSGPPHSRRAERPALAETPVPIMSTHRHARHVRSRALPTPHRLRRFHTTHRQSGRRATHPNTLIRLACHAPGSGNGPEVASLEKAARQLRRQRSPALRPPPCDSRLPTSGPRRA